MRSLFYARLAATNIRLNRRIYVPYMLTCVGTAALYYIIYSLSQNVSLSQTYGGGNVTYMLYLGSNVIAIFAVLFLFYTNSFLLKRRKKEFGLYSVLGMEKRHISLTIFYETVCIAAVSIISGLVAGLLLSKAVHLLLLKLVHIEAVTAIEITAPPMLRTAGLFLIIFALTFLNTVRVVHTARPIELLKGGETGEREPRGKWIITLLGLICLGGGYYLAVTIETPLTALLLFFVAVILVVIGTYCLFISGSISLLRLLKRNKRYYYKTRHFISVSGMIYRMKQNAAGLASICIFCTCVLVILSMTISLYAGVEDILVKRYPRDISLHLYDPDEGETEKLNALVEDALSDAGASSTRLTAFRYDNFAANPDGNEMLNLFGGEYSSELTSAFITMIPLADYNRALGLNVSLGADEALIYVEAGRYDQGEIRFGDRTYTIAGSIEDPALYTGDVSVYSNLYLLIMPDEQDIKYVRSLAPSEGGGQPRELTYWYGLDVSVQGDEQLALYDDIAARMEDLGFTWYSISRAANGRESIYSLYGGLFFIGIFLGAMFIMATVLIIYYKQISEGYEDNERFRIMQKVGMSRQEVREAIRSQVLTVFFLPLGVAAVHVAFAFKIMTQLLAILDLTNVTLFAWCCLATLLIFSLLYALIYAITARTYYKIVSV